jgi:hypothetical protein
MEDGQDTYKRLQIGIAILSIIGAIWGGIWTFSDKIATADDLKRLEQKTVDTFKNLQDNIDTKFYQQQLTILQDRKYRIKDEMRKNPNDESLKQDYEAVNKDISTIESKILENKKN